MLNKVKKIIETTRNKKKYILLSYFIQKWCLISIFMFYVFFFSLFIGCWKLNVDAVMLYDAGGCRFILFSMAVEWTKHHHHHLYFETLNACPFFFFLSFWIGMRACIEIEERDGMYVVWRFRSFSNIVLYIPFYEWEHWALSINHCDRFERQETTMKRHIEWKESKYKLIQNITNSFRF